MKNGLARISSFRLSGKLDSAIILSEKLIRDLEALGHNDRPFGLKLQLAYGTALEARGFDTLAIRSLLHVEKTSKALGEWETHAECCRVLASLHEKIGRLDQSFLFLRQAQAEITRYGLDTIYPRFAIRIASCHRITGNRDSAFYYATEALRTARQFGQVFEEAEANLLLGILSLPVSVEKSLEHYNAAKSGYRKLGMYYSLYSIFANISRVYLRNNDLNSALAYNDSAMVTDAKGIAAGMERYYGVYTGYKMRGEIYEALGKPDSALFYFRKGYEMELNFVHDEERRKVVEIDARYQSDKKAVLLKEQEERIRYDREKTNWILAATVILVLFAGVLIQYSRRLQKINRKIDLQAKQLKHLDAAKSRFFANMSHELRTPLTLILGSVKSLMKEKQLSEKQIRLLQMANHSGQQLHNLVNQILDLQKLEAGKMGLNEKPTAITGFLRSYAEQFKSLAAHKQIDYSFETNLDEGLAAFIDQEKCRQILNNLISNAIKYTQPGGQVKVRVQTEQYGNKIPKLNQLQISVADTGPGIHPDDMPHLFDRFFQTTRPEKPMEGGTGIGLALCHEYAKLFKGKIEVESALGKGAVFRVTFPIREVDAREALWPDVQPEDPNLSRELPVLPQPNNSDSKPTILVVDDYPELLEYIRLVLDEKYHLVTAENGKAALEWLQASVKQEAPPSLILSDLMMPIMDGSQLLEKVKSDDDTRHIPFVMITARAEAQDKLKALRIGVDDYLTKPFDEEELLARIENLLRHQRARQPDIQHETEAEDSDTVISEADQMWLETFEAHAQNHLSDDTLNVPMMARAFNMSESTLLRQLRRLTGLSPAQYLHEMRLVHARRMLENRTYDSIAKIAFEVGYKDARSFSRSFRQRFGKLPSDFLNE